MNIQILDQKIKKLTNRLEILIAKRDKLLWAQETKSTKSIPIPEAAKSIKVISHKKSQLIRSIDKKVERVSINDINYIWRQYGFAEVITNPIKTETNKLPKIQLKNILTNSIITSYLASCDAGSITGNRRSTKTQHIIKHSDYTKTMELEFFYKLLYLGYFAKERDFKDALDFPRFMSEYQDQLPDILFQARELWLLESELRFYITFQKDITNENNTQPILSLNTTKEPSTKHFAYYQDKFKMKDKPSNIQKYIDTVSANTLD